MQHLSFLVSLRYLKYLINFFILLIIIILPIAVYSVYNSPEDYLQGITVKIMYIHVPSAWLAVSLYVVMSSCCLLYLIFTTPVYDLLAKAISLVGLAFSLITLVTGAIWGKPTWGVYWVWDARLTSMLVLAFLYFSYISLRNGFASDIRAAKSSSLLAIIGLINIPIIKLSVNLWNTLHQPASLFRMDGTTIHVSMLYPLIISFVALLIIAILIILFRIKIEIYVKKHSRKIHSL